MHKQSMGNNRLGSSDAKKDLGVVTDNKLNKGEAVANKANAILYHINKRIVCRAQEMVNTTRRWLGLCWSNVCSNGHYILRRM